MAWGVNGANMTMTVNDYGVELPITVDVGLDLGEQDTLKFTFKKEVGGEDLMVKEFTGITDNTIRLVITEAESEQLPVGQYVYRLDWYQTGSFMNCIVEDASFKVVRKA